jgi:hypothetical protein
MDTAKLGTGDIIAAAAGFVLLIALFLPWYGAEAEFGGVSVSESANAWQTMSFIDILLFLVAVIAIAVPVARAMGSLPADVPGPLLVLAAGALGVLLVLFRLVDIPAPDLPGVADGTFGFGRELGVFVALIAVAGIAYGGWRANMERPGAPAVARATAPPAA